MMMTSDARTSAATRPTSRTLCRVCWITTPIPGPGQIALGTTLLSFWSEYRDGKNLNTQTVHVGRD